MTTTGNTTEITSDLEKLKLECDRKWEKLKKLQDELNALQPPGVLDGVDQLTSINKADEQMLTAQIDLIQNASHSVKHRPDKVSEVVLHDSLNKTNGQLKETHCFMESQLNDLKAELQSQREHRYKLEKLLEAMQAAAQVGDQEAGKINSRSGNKTQRMLSEISDKQKNLDKAYRLWMKELNAFMEKHFPLPKTEEVRRMSRKVDYSLEYDGNLVSLQEIIEELMNKCLATPHDPYLNLDSSHWPPYVELLLRCAIALRHPEDPKRIKLTPFHV